MLMAIKRGIVVALGILLQFGFAIFIQLFFKEHITIIGVFYGLISILIVLNLLKNSTRLSNDIPFKTVIV